MPFTYSPGVKKTSNLTSELLFKKYFEKIFDDLHAIPKLWDSLGVTQEYKVHFVNVVMELDNAVREEFFEYEINNLTRIAENLKVRDALVLYLFFINTLDSI